MSPEEAAARDLLLAAGYVVIPPDQAAAAKRILLGRAGRTPRWPGCTDTLCGNPRPHTHL